MCHPGHTQIVAALTYALFHTLSLTRTNTVSRCDLASTEAVMPELKNGAYSVAGDTHPHPWRSDEDRENFWLTMSRRAS